MNASVGWPTTLEDFLAWEEDQDLRWEFDGGAPVAMPPASVEHGLIAANVVRELGGRLRSPCQVFGGDRCLVAAGAVRYPDATVLRTQLSPVSKLLSNPVVLFEVLSPETALADLVLKNREYAALPSVRRYLALEQDRIGGLLFSREHAGWIGRLLQAGDRLDMPEIGVELPLSAFYAGLELPVRRGHPT